MKVLGIDPGLAKCGWAIIEKDLNKEYKLLSFGEIDTQKSAKYKTMFLTERLETIFLELKKIFKKHKPDIVCIESQFYSKISKNMIHTYFATGIIYLLCGLFKIQIEDFSAKTVKLAVSGYGSASKLQLKKMIKLLLKNEKEISSEHINDAIAVALCYLNTQHKELYV
ncbi:MAG: crossover junction endodeoxyribonuclease RuvC [Endomicrobiia bacterium]